MEQAQEGWGQEQEEAGGSVPPFGHLRDHTVGGTPTLVGGMYRRLGLIAKHPTPLMAGQEPCPATECPMVLK